MDNSCHGSSRSRQDNKTRCCLVRRVFLSQSILTQLSHGTKMSSQANTTIIPFSIAHEQQPVRLLELPPAILSLITSGDPPTCVRLPSTYFPVYSHPCRLKIKAAPTSIATTHTGATADHAVLCTSDKTFSLRQVHSSNTSFLLSPPTSEDGGGGGITATSTVTSYIELLPVTPDTKSLLRSLLLPYPTAAIISSSGSKSNVGMSKDQLRNNLPVSDAEFESAWTDLSAFEYNNSSYISTAEGLLSALKEAFTNAAAAGVKLCTPFRLDALLDDECEIPLALVETVVSRICERKGNRWVLLPQKAAHVVGRWVLEEWHTSGKPDMLYVSFISRWKAAVPQECKLLCNLDVLKVRLLSNYLWRVRKGC